MDEIWRHEGQHCHQLGDPDILRGTPSQSKEYGLAMCLYALLREWGPPRLILRSNDEHKRRTKQQYQRLAATGKRRGIDSGIISSSRWRKGIGVVNIENNQPGQAQQMNNEPISTSTRLAPAALICVLLWMRRRGLAVGEELAVCLFIVWQAPGRKTKKHKHNKKHLISYSFTLFRIETSNTT